MYYDVIIGITRSGRYVTVGYDDSIQIKVIGIEDIKNVNKVRFNDAFLNFEFVSELTNVILKSNLISYEDKLSLIEDVSRVKFTKLDDDTLSVNFRITEFLFNYSEYKDLMKNSESFNGRFIDREVSVVLDKTSKWSDLER